jgi:Tfp pilus assembly protein PilE
MRENHHNEIGPDKSSRRQVDNDEFIARLKVKKNNVASEIRGSSSQRKIRKPVKQQSSQRKFRADGSTHQNHYDPRLKREHHEEEAWSKKSSKSSRKNRKALIVWLIAGLLVIIAIVSGLVYYKKSTILAEKADQQDFFQIQNQRVLELPNFSIQDEDPVATKLTSLEALAARTTQYACSVIAASARANAASRSWIGASMLRNSFASDLLPWTHSTASSNLTASSWVLRGCYRSPSSRDHSSSS